MADATRPSAEISELAYPKRGKVEGQKGWWIPSGYGFVTFQRAEIQSAGDTPLSINEQVICGLCETVERLLSDKEPG